MASANAQRGHLGFEVDETRYTFAFSTNALCAAEEVFGLEDISGLGDILGGSPSLRTVRTLFRLGLTDSLPDITDREAGDLIDKIGGLVPAVELLGAAVQAAFPEAAKGGGKNPPKPAAAKTDRGNGGSSTGTGAR